MSHMEISNVTKNYGQVRALTDVSLNIEKGEFVCVLGPSGCGKSTLLRVVAGLENIESGRICIGGRDVTMESPSRRNFGIVFQSYALFPNMNVRQNIAYGLASRKLEKGVISRKVDEALELVSLTAHAGKYPQELSGGQQQRVALARAIVLEPEFLLLDEPLSALDAKVRIRLRREIKNLQQKLGITTIMVTHDQEEVLSMADKIVVMNQAVIEQIGTPEQVYENPATGFVADFIGTVNIIDDKYAIRPENISLSQNPDSLTGRITDIEYRGSFYRLTIESLMGEIAVDLKSDVHRHMRFTNGAVIYFELCKENLILLSRVS